MNSIVWNKAKNYILPFEGGASQIHLIDICKYDLEYVLNIILNKLKLAKLTLLKCNPVNILFNVLNIRV